MDHPDPLFFLPMQDEHGLLQAPEEWMADGEHARPALGSPLPYVSQRGTRSRGAVMRGNSRGTFAPSESATKPCTVRVETTFKACPGMVC